MIYLDNAATTPIHRDVFEAMRPYLTEEFGNPSSIHQFGRRARSGIDKARSEVAKWIGCPAQSVVFTSGGTEANHTAIFGAYLAGGGRKHIVTTAIEHHAVLETCLFLKNFGVDVTLVHPDAAGNIRAEDVLRAVRPDTFCVSVMSVNNEVGTIQPILEIARAVKEVDKGIAVHSDMVQAAGGFRIPLEETEIDLASFSAHKIHGPKGVGALYVRPGAKWQPVVHGGGQERKRRAGTENVASIVGFGVAARRMYLGWESHLDHLRQVRDAFWSKIQSIPGIRRNSPEDAVPSILNVGFEGIKSDVLLARLDMAGVAASSGSACTAGSIEPSHVLIACGQPAEQVYEAIRFSFSDMTTVEEAVRAGQIVRECVEQIQSRKR
jgi:cysteine desulfurase